LSVKYGSQRSKFRDHNGWAVGELLKLQKSHIDGTIGAVHGITLH